MSIYKEDYKGYTIEIVRDTDPSDPRENDNLAHLICWHRKYKLGDENPQQAPIVYQSGLVAKVYKEYKTQLEKLIPVADDADVRRLLEQNKNLQALFETVLEANYLVVPLYLMDHSGLAISTKPFSCPWDSGQLGFAYVSLDEARKNWLLDEQAAWTHVLDDWDENGKKTGHTITLREAARRLIESEVREYDAYISGQVYGFRILEEGREVDSCWGFITTHALDDARPGSVLAEARAQVDSLVAHGPETEDPYESLHKEWKEAVAADKTTEGFEDWIQTKQKEDDDKK